MLAAGHAPITARRRRPGLRRPISDPERSQKMPPREITPEAFSVLLDRAGLSPTPEQSEELRDAYKFIQEMAARVRTPRTRAAEPAHIFTLPVPDSAE